MEEEIWKDIDDFPGYQASSNGYIRSFRDFHGNITNNFKILKAQTDKDGYYTLCLYTINREKITKRVHRIVAETFFGKHDNLVVNHINGIKTDNRIDNLEFITAEQNSTLAAKDGLYKTKSVKIIETGEIFKSIKECAEALGVHPSNISECLSNRNKQNSSRGFHFEYVDEQEIKQEIKQKRNPFLYDYQMEAIEKLHNGCILCGSVGSGKSRTGLFYYFKENGGWIDENGYKSMKNPQDLYIITTAKKRDSLEWDGELSNFLLSRHPDLNKYSNKIIVDSWNNIGKYKDIQGAFFLLDEQRLVGNGAWVKSFLKISKTNNWILLTATPADSYQDYIPVFIANGFFKNRTEFNKEHVIYSRFTKYPKIDRYVNTRRLDRLRNKILVDMDFKRQTIPHHEDIWCTYDIPLYKNTLANRWNYFTNKPIKNAGELCLLLRKIVNSDQSRRAEVLKLFVKHPKMIIFYNFNYERDILRDLYYGEDVEIAEWSGHAHQPVPDSKKWVYLVQYTAGCEGWNCVRTDTIVFYSQNYSYKVMIQAAGRIDRLNTPFTDLYYYHLKSRASIDLAINKALSKKKKFNEGKFVKWD